MIFQDEIIQYLKGEKFSSGLKIQVAKSQKGILNRFDFLKEISRGKKVIHLGFADHIPLIDDKIKNNTWLHKTLYENAALCIGIDNNIEAVEFIKNKFNINNLFVHDITSLEKLEIIEENSWDYLIMGEVLEHVDNPVNFLERIKVNYGSSIRNIVITVPNAFDLENINLLIKNIEFINTDHRYWFTPFTLAKIATCSGYSIKSYSFCNSYLPSNWLKKYLLKRFPILCEGIIMVIEL